MRDLEVSTEHPIPIRTLCEVLHEFLPEALFEITSSEPKKVEQEDESEDEESGSEEEEESGSEEEESEAEESDAEDLEAEESEEEDSEEEEDEEDSEEEDEDEEEEKKTTGCIRIMAVDTTKTILIHLKLEGDKFSTFKCRKKRMTLGVKLEYLHKLLKVMDKDDHLTLYVDSEDENHLGIRIDNSAKKNVTCYKLKLMDLDEEKLRVPSTTFDSVITMPAVEFHKVCREMNAIADYVEIQCVNEKLVFSCKGEYAERSSTYWQNEKGVNVQHTKTDSDEPQIVKGIYELKTLKLFGKCSTLSNNIEIYMKNNYPLVIKYTVATFGKLLVCITPVNPDAVKDDEDEYSDDEYYDDVVVNYKEQ